MDPIEATSNIVVAMLNNKCISSPEDVSKAYTTIFNCIKNTYLKS